MKKLLLCFLALWIFIVTSCNLGLTPTNSYYYIQQSQEVDAEITKPTEDITLSFGIMFDVLKPNGVIDQKDLETYLGTYETLLNTNKDVLQQFYNQLQEIPVIKKEQDTTFPLVDFTTFNFAEKLLVAEFTDKNVPIMKYVDSTTETEWQLSDDISFLVPLENEKNEHIFSYEGENTKAGVNPITQVEYFKYESKNPFFAIDSAYNNDEISSTNEETGMSRFLFYRFKGKGGGIVNLDNMLVAVDTYTSLIFSFGVPTEFETILGQDSPTKWEAVEVAASAPNGQKYKFYEYDPAGYVDANGNFVMYDWYTQSLSQANAANQTNFYPQFTGVSPYLVNFDIKKPTFTVTSDLNDEKGNYTEISGFIFNEPPATVASYDIYRIDDSSSERKLIKENHSLTELYKDYDALILTKNPQYIIESKDNDGKLIGAASDVVEGTRKLTDREVLLATIETIRYALIDQGAHGSLNPTKVVASDNGGTFTYKKSGVFSPTYTYTLDNFEPFVVTLSTYAPGVPITYKSKSLLTSILTFEPYTGTINITGDYTGSLTFTNIRIANNDKNNPDWTEGTLDYIIGSSEKQIYDKDGDIPFGFYMDKETFIEKILGDDGVYLQE